MTAPFAHVKRMTSDTDPHRTSHKPWHRRLLVAGLGVLAALAGGSYVMRGLQHVGGCGQEWSARTRSRLSDLRIRQPLLLFDAQGRLVRRDLVTGAETMLSDHGFESVPSVVRSADGRWLSYSGTLADLRRKQYWLYDLEAGQDRLVLETPAWGGAIPVFSPDGQRLAIAANHDSRWPDASMAGTYVFDTATLQVRRLGIPAAVPATAAWTLPEWSTDGSRLLLMTRDFRDGAERPREYRSWTLGASEAMAMEGRWVEAPHHAGGRDEWLLNDAVVPVFEQRTLQGSGGFASSNSPDGVWSVKVVEQDGAAALEFTDKVGRVRRADAGPYDACEGYAIRLIGWIDAGHLVYGKPGGVTLVVEPATGRVAPLLHAELDRGFQFGW